MAAEVVGLIASLFRSIQLFNDLMGSIPQVTENQAYYRTVLNRLTTSATQFEELLRHQDRLVDAPDLRNDLSNANQAVLSLHAKVSKDFKEREGLGRAKIWVTQWWKAGYLRRELERINEDIVQCYHRFSAGCVARIELQNEVIRRQNEEIIRQNQASLHYRNISRQHPEFRLQYTEVEVTGQPTQGEIGQSAIYNPHKYQGGQDIRSELFAPRQGNACPRHGRGAEWGKRSLTSFGSYGVAVPEVGGFDKGERP